MEAAGWVNSWPDPEEPKAWLRDKNPTLYDKMFPAKPRQGRLVNIDPDLIATFEGDPNFLFWAGTPREYMDQHGAEIDAVYSGYGGRPGQIRGLGPHAHKFLGNFIFDNYLEVMSDHPSFPGDLWRLVEERLLEPLAWIDLAEYSDPEGSDFSFEVSPEEGLMWAAGGAYQPGHLFLYPHGATGSQSWTFSIKKEFPGSPPDWIKPVIPKVNGIITGTRNHTGYYPRIEVVLEQGRIKEVRGGGDYGEFLRTLLELPKLHTVHYPYYDEPNYWFLYEAGTGTNPKFFLRIDELRDGRNSSERNVAGVLHWSFGTQINGEPPGQEGTWEEFVTRHNVPRGHGFHIHHVLPTYRVRIRATETWLTLIDSGRLAPLDHSEVRALASRYGDPDRILRQDWVADLPGINSPGNYQDFASDPWAHLEKVLEQIDQGTYPYLTKD